MNSMALIQIKSDQNHTDKYRAHTGRRYTRCIFSWLERAVFLLVIGVLPLSTVVSCVISVFPLVWITMCENESMTISRIWLYFDWFVRKETSEREMKRVRKQKTQVSETHLKWTVLPNWEMKSNDAKGKKWERRQWRNRASARTRMRENKRERQGTRGRERETKKLLFIQLVMTRIRDVACIDLAYICASGVSRKCLDVFSISWWEREKIFFFPLVPRCHRNPGWKKRI